MKVFYYYMKIQCLRLWKKNLKEIKNNNNNILLNLKEDLIQKIYNQKINQDQGLEIKSKKRINKIKK